MQFDLGWVALNVRPGDVFLQVEFEGAVGRGDVERVYVTLFKDHVVGGWGCGCAVLGCVIRGGSDRRCVVWSISSVCGRHWRDSRKQQGKYTRGGGEAGVDALGHVLLGAEGCLGGGNWCGVGRPRLVP